MKPLLNLLILLIPISIKAQVPNEGSKYQMKEIAIKTRWAEEVGPDNALTEYPRPQLERKNWINLNGLWDYSITSSKFDEAKQYDGKILVPYSLESALSGVKKSLQPTQVL